MNIKSIQFQENSSDRMGAKFLIPVKPVKKNIKSYTFEDITYKKYSSAIKAYRLPFISFQAGYSSCNKDFNYRKALAEGLKAAYKGMNISSDALKSVMGTHELKYILKNEPAENFSTGASFKNVLNGTFRINLHMHTFHSDGNMSVQELLDQAVKYAAFRKTKGKTDPFIVSITDHDILEGTKEAIKIIAEAPEKYKNIRFVPGIEFNTYKKFDNLKGKFKDIIQFEMLGYGINPFITGGSGEKDVAKFVEDIRNNNRSYLIQLITEGPGKLGQPDRKIGGFNDLERQAGISEKNLTKPEEFMNRSIYSKIPGSPALMGGFETAMNKICTEKNGQIKSDEWIKKVKDLHDANYGIWYVNSGTPSFEKLAKVVNDSGYGFVSVAHPARNLKSSRGVKKSDYMHLFQQFKDSGVKAAEVNYQYSSHEHWIDQGFKDIIAGAAENAGMLKTGGLDNHETSIFFKRMDENKLTKEVKLITGL